MFTKSHVLHLETTVGNAVKRVEETKYTTTHLYELFCSRIPPPQERLVFVPDLRRWVTDARLDNEDRKPLDMRLNLVIFRMNPVCGKKSVHAQMEVGAAIGRLSQARNNESLYDLFGGRNFRADEYMRFEPDLQMWIRDRRLDDERVRAVELLREKWKRKRFNTLNKHTLRHW